MAKHATIRLKGLKVMQPIPAELVPVDLVPPDGPAGNPSITLELEGVGPVCTAQLNGKSYRRMLKALADRPGWAAGPRGRGHLGRAPVPGGAGRRRWRLICPSCGRDHLTAGEVPPA